MARPEGPVSHSAFAGAQCRVPPPRLTSQPGRGSGRVPGQLGKLQMSPIVILDVFVSRQQHRLSTAAAPGPLVSPWLGWAPLSLPRRGLRDPPAAAQHWFAARLTGFARRCNQEAPPGAFLRHVSEFRGSESFSQTCLSVGQLRVVGTSHPSARLCRSFPSPSDKAAVPAGVDTAFAWRGGSRIILILPLPLSVTSLLSAHRNSSRAPHPLLSLMLFTFKC